MFNAKNVIGWIGNMAVVKVSNGVYLVDWSNGKRIFVPKESENFK
jgi:hypothetical protein